MRSDALAPRFRHAAGNRFIAPTLLAIVALLTGMLRDASAQTQFYWRGDAGLNGNWNASDKWWIGSASAAGFGQLNFNNNAYLLGTNDTSFSTWRIYFDAAASTARTNVGTGTITFYDYGAQVPVIRNDSTATHQLNMPISIGNTTGADAATRRLEIVAAAGDLSFSGTLSTANELNVSRELRLDASSGRNITLSGVITEANSSNAMQIRKVGTGTATLSGSSANTYTLGTTVEAGTLILNKSAGINAIGTGAMTINSGATVSASAASQFGSSYVNNNGTFNFNNNNQQMALAGAGTVSLGSATLTNTNAGDDTFSGVISGSSGSLIKAGAGTLRLTGTSSSFTGATTILNGLLAINGDGSLGTAPGTATANSIILSNATLGFNGGFTLNANRGLSLSHTSATLNVFDGNTVTYNGIIAESGTAALTKSGGGTLNLGGNNSFTGATTVGSGAVRATSATAFGTTAGGVSVSSGAAVELSGDITVGAEALTLNGTGIGNAGALRNISGANTWSGGISNASGARINSDSGLLTISGNITNAASQSLYVGGAGSVTLGGTLTGTLTTGNGALYKDGAGVLTLTNDNSGLTGLVRLLGGTIGITNNNSLGSGTLELGGLATQAILSVGTNTSRSQTLLIQNSSTNSVINVASGSVFTSTGSLTQDGALANTTKFGKDGSGTLVLAGASGNTYNGQIQIGNGTIIAGTSTALGTNASTANRGIDLGLNISDTSQANNVALLASNGVTVSNSIYVAPNTSSALRTIGLSGNGTNTFSTEIFLGGTLTVDAGSSATDLVTISAAATSTGGIVKSGSGTLALTAANTYSGTTTLSNGTLLLSGGNNRIATGNTVDLGGTSTLNLGGNSQTLYNLTAAAIINAGTATVTNGSLVLAANANTGTVLGDAQQGSVIDMSGLSSFTVTNTAGTSSAFSIRAGTNTAAGNTNTFYLSKTVNTFVVPTLTFGAAAGSVGNANLTDVRLGTTNIFYADTFRIGGFNGAGSVSLQSGLSSPSVTIRGTNGVAAANSFIVGETSSGVRSGSGTVDLTGATVSILATNFQLGRHIAGANNNESSSFTMNAGTVTVTNMTLADKTGNGTNTVTAVFTQGGGTVSASVLAFGALTTNSTTTNLTRLLPTYNLNGGTLYVGTANVGTNALSASNTSVRTLSINGGVLRNLNASTDAVIYGADTSASGRLNILLSNNSANTIYVDASRTMTISNTAVMGGAGGFIKDGTGTLSLSAANTNTGAITVSNGTLLTTTSGVLGSSSAVSVASGATLQLGGAQTVGSIAGAGTINMGANLLTFGGDNSSTTFSGALSGAGGFTKTGTGTTTVTGAGVSSGTVQVNAGGLTLNPGAGNTFNLGNRFQMAPSSGTATVTFSSGTNNVSTDAGISGLGDGSGGTANFNVSGGTVNVNMSTNRFLVGNKQAAVVTVSSGTLNFTNNNNLYIGGDTQYTTGAGAATGTMTISGGAVNVTGTGSFVLGVSTNAAGTINLDGGSLTTARNITLGNTGTGMTGTINFNGGTLVANLSTNNFLGGLTALKVKSGGAAISTTNAVTISNALTEDGSSTGGGFTKSGTGTVTLAGVNTYTGATTVNAGTLSYMGTNTSTATTVASGGTLAGSGSLGAVTVQSGATISPGSSPGTLSVGALTWDGGGSYNWQVYDAAGTAGATNGYDTIRGNSLNIAATTGNKFNINLWSLSGIGPDVNGSAINFTNGNSTNWTLGTFTNGITNFSTGVFSVNTGATNGTGGFANTFTGSFSLTTNSTNVILVYTAAAGSYDISVGANTAANQGSAQATNSANLLTGAVALNKLGAGTLVMTNPANDYTGVTTIQEGTVQINVNAPSGSAGALGNAITAVLLGDSTNAVAAGFNIGAANVTNSRNLTVVAGTGAAERVIGTTISSGTADQAGGITLNTNAVLNAASGGTMLYSGVLTGSGNLTISNSGTSVFSAANDYTGTTTILSGATLRIANSSALGGTGSGTTVNSGGVLELTNGITSAEAITLSGSGIGSAGAVRSIRGNNTLSGALTLGAAARINSDSDLLTLSGGINGTNHNLTVGGSGNTTISGAITNSTGLLTKEGSGTLILTGANTYSGGTLVSAGTLQGNTTGLQGLITNNAAVIFDQSANGTHGSVISGTGVMVKTNTGVLTLTAANTQSGGTLIGQGTLSIGSGGTSGSLAGAITNNATLLYNRSDDLTQATVISGTGALHKAGGGTLTLSQANTYSGATTISNGAIRISNGTGLGTAAAGTTVVSGAALELSGGITVGAESLALSGTGLGSGGALRNISGNNTYGGTITLGAASLISSDSGLLTVTGDINGANNGLTFLGADNIAVSGAITNSSGALIKGGSGTLTLSGNNTYSGATTISNGSTIVAASANALGATSGATTVNDGGVLAFSNATGFTSAENITIGTTTGGALRNLGGANTNTGTITLAANATISADSGSTLRMGNIDNGSTSRTLTFSNAGTVLVTGNFANMDTTSTFYKDGTGSLVISNTTANTGGAQLQLGGGTVTLAAGTFSTNSGTGTRGLDLGLTAGNQGSTLDTAFYVNGGVTMSNSVYVASGTGTRTLGTESTSGTATFNNEIYLDKTLTVSAAAGGTALFSGAIITNFTGGGAQGVTKTGAGTVILSGANTFRGDVTVSQGALVLSNASGAAVYDTNAVAVSGGATLGIERSETIGQLTGAGTASIASGQTLTTTNDGAAYTFSGDITGSGGFTKAGSGTITLTGSNNYAGTTTVNGGAIMVGNNSALGATGGTTTVASGAALQLSNATLSSEAVSVTGSGVGSTGAIYGHSGNNTSLGLLTFSGNNVNTYIGAASGATLTLSNLSGGNNELWVVGNGNTTIAGGATNTGATTLVKTNTGTLVLGSANSWNGNEYIRQGTVVLSNNNALGTAGTTFLGAFEGSATATLQFGSGITNSNALTVEATGTGTRTLSYQAGSGSAEQRGNISLGSLLTADVASGGSLTASGDISGANALTKSGGGTFTLSGNNTYSGATTIAGGTLRVSGNNRLGNTSTTLTISNAGVLEVTSAGRLTNAITIGAGNGVLSNSSGGALVIAGSVSKNGTVFTSRSGSGTNVFTGVISGASANSDFVVDGGTTVFSNAMTYNGPTIITNGGTLVLGTNNAVPTSSGLVLGGGTFIVGNSSTHYSQTLGTLTLTENSVIDLGSYSGSPLVQLTFANSSAISWVTGKTLTISNWQGVAYQSSDVAEIIFGTGGLTSTQLGQIYFANQNINGGTLNGGELVPIPEPRVYAAALALVAAVGWRERRRLLGLLRRRK